MRARWRHAAVALTAIGLVGLVQACGDDDKGSSGPGLTGLYEVTTHTATEMGCDDPQPVADVANCFDCAVRADFFKVKSQSFFGQTILVMVDCASETACDDDGEDPDTINLSGPLFDRASGGGWLGEVKAASGSGTSCSYTAVEYRLDPDGEGVTFMSTRETANPEVANEDACLDLVDNPPPASALTCDRLEVVSGRAL